ncbi:unnamed protein product [Cylindrotheca closterium]|uniref:Uncharacterized protein n=1 Tax=Cylindrotheca closterium TaxID=2856 RepID=A0AAD2G4K5_9STRA|nr:unnamed protein product [Cylindrotheca closterium]
MMPNTPSMQGEANQFSGTPNVPREITENEKTLALTVKSWDQIGALKSEIVSSIMAKQASILSKRFANNDAKCHPRKRQKTGPLLTAETNSLEQASSRVSEIVTSDEGSAIESSADSQTTEESSLVDDLESDRQIDRLGKISRLMVQLEYFHQELRHEIVSISQEFDIDS